MVPEAVQRVSSEVLISNPSGRSVLSLQISHGSRASGGKNSAQGVRDFTQVDFGLARRCQNRSDHQQGREKRQNGRIRRSLGHGEGVMQEGTPDRQAEQL